MKLQDIFTRFSIDEETTKKRVAYLIASFGCLYFDENQDEDIVANDIDYIDDDELGDYFVSNYDLVSGCYTKGGHFLSLENIIGAIAEFERY